MINNKQRFSQRMISMMYNVKNFLARVINVYIGKGTLIYLSIIILIFSISIFLYANIRSKNESFYYATLAIGLISSLLLMFFVVGRIVMPIMTFTMKKREKNWATYVCIIIYAITAIILSLCVSLFIVNNEMVKKAFEIMSLNIVIPFVVAPFLFYQYTKYVEKKTKQNIVY